MPDLAELFRWQWMWKSRSRLIAIALGAMTVGVGLMLFAVLCPGPFNKGKGLVIAGGVILGCLGAYQLLQGLFSPTGAFGDHDRTREVPSLASEQKRKRKKRTTPRCSVCTERVTTAVECPKCHERLNPD